MPLAENWVERDAEFGEAVASHEGTVLFMVANFQYLVTCITFSVGEPFRKSWWTNQPFLLCVLLIFLVNLSVIFLPDDSMIAQFFNLLPFKDYSYRF